ncbi:MAG: hydrogenase maturation protease [Acidimicrobiia bacterium]|nr:hydrogenase maturation protease [Acidimicrobiia bacterium]
MTDAFVVGYGNDLRSDDGAGRWVADEIEGRALPGVAVRSISQLTPELALDIAGRDVVVFVDADVDVSELTVRPVAAKTTGAQTMTHHGDPATLLAMVSAVGEPPRRAYVVSIPATNLEMGLTMTDATRAAADEAVALVVQLLSGEAGEA